MNLLVDFAGHMLIFTLASTAVVLMLYGLARGLRARGYGPILDALVGWHGRISMLGTLHTLHALRAIQRLPLYGSRQQREIIDLMIVRVQRETDPSRHDLDR
jgi:hypothetical protein